MHKFLFGNITLVILEEYVNYVKNIKKDKISKKLKTEYISKKNNLQNEYNLKAKINPKVDNKNQRRVQCSISNFKDLLRPFITYISPINKPNLLRNKLLSYELHSNKRIRFSNRIKQQQDDNKTINYTKKELLNICKNNKNICKNYSSLKKYELNKYLCDLNLIKITNNLK